MACEKQVKQAQRAERKHDRYAKARTRLKERRKKGGAITRARIAAYTAAANLWAKREKKAKAALVKCRREQLPEDRRLAQALIVHRNTRFYFVSPTGGSARDVLEDYVRKGTAYVAATGQRVELSVGFLRGMLAQANAGMVMINCVTNGRHTQGSNHYKGRAVDLDEGSGLPDAVCESIGRQHNMVRNFERDHMHFDYVG